MRARILVVLACALGLAACEPAVTDSPTGTTWTAATLTADGSDRYLAAGGPAFTVATAPLGNTGGNTRIVLTDPADPTGTDQAVCTTITGATSLHAQPGVVLRFDGVHAVTVTRNLWGDVHTVVNVHAWDLTLPLDNGRFVLAGQWPLTGIGSPAFTAAPYPWRMCASAVGAAVSFKVWPLTRAEPGDGDPCCTGSLPLPVWPGRAGLYVGHLPPGHTLAYSDTTRSSP